MMVWSRTRAATAGALAMSVAASVVASVAVVMVPSAATGTGGLVADPVGYVDPFIGSARGGNTWPGATRPFGMLAWSPTSTTGDQTSTGAANGYRYEVTKVRGFSLTHVNGAGCNPGAAGDVPIMPYVGTVDSSPSADATDARYVATFAHTNESATPGRYTVTLDSGVRTDLAVTTRAGVGGFRFPAGSPANLLFRVSNSLNGSEDAAITIDPATRTVRGSVLTGAFCGRRANGGTNNRRSYYRLFFSAVFDRDFASTGTWHDATVTPGGTVATGGEGYATGSQRAGRGSGGWVGFDPAAGTEVRMRIGISYVDLAGAESNRDTELRAGTTVDRVAAAARRAWSTELRRIRVAGGTDARLTAFYTSVYHSLMQPQTISDVDGRYLGADLAVHRITRGQRAQYGTFSGWDQYRAQIQLLALQATVQNADALSDAGCPGQCAGQRPALDTYLALGYAPQDGCHCWGGAAETLENALADFSLAMWALRSADGDRYRSLLPRAGAWRNTFNPLATATEGYQQARRADGSWQAGFTPSTDVGFAQGSSATYTWMVPQDVTGLGALMGGADVAAARLDRFFHDDQGNWAVGGGSALRYDPTNEPGIHAPWMYNALGQPWKTQATVRQIVDTVYGTGPAGLPGNDDLGTMSAWYVFAAIGMFPQVVGRAELLLASPVFSTVVIERAGGVRMVVRARSAGAGDTYIRGVRVDGVATNRSWLPESFVRRGGVVSFTLAGQPDTSWGTAPRDLPVDHVTAEPVSS
jgi:putative alpha-1,2-mannosidase